MKINIVPHDLEAEQGILGAILFNNQALHKAREILSYDDFYKPAHGRIFKAMVELEEQNQVIDLIILTDHLRRAGDLAGVGGSAYLAELGQSVATSAAVVHHANIVKRKAFERRSIAIINGALSRLNEGQEDVQRIVEATRNALSDCFDSIPAYKSGPLHETVISPRSAPELLTETHDEPVEWILEDYLPAGGLIVEAGKPKEGKTTLTYELAVKVANKQTFLGRQTSGGGVLILALEEHPRDVRLRLQALGAQNTPNLYVHCGPLDSSPTVLESIKRFVMDNEIKLVIVDTLAAFWRVADENDAAVVTKALRPLLALARESGACLLLIHHARKSDGSYGDEIRGSGALFAIADVAIILKRHEIQNQRVLHGISRYPETPAELAIELREFGYVALGDPAAVNKHARREKVKAALPDEPEEAEVIVKRAGVPLRDGYRLLAALVKSGEAEKEGKGRKGSPYRFRKNAFHAGPPSYRDGTESGESVSDSCSPPSPCMKENPVPEREVIDLAD